MDTIHLQPSLELKFVLIFFYLFIWYIIDKSFIFVNSDKNIRLSLVKSFFYCIVSPVFGLILIYQFFINDANYWPIHIHIILAGIAFYMFELIEGAKRFKKVKIDIAIHHIVFGLFFFVYIVNLNLELVWWTFFAVQSSCAFCSLSNLLKKINIQAYYRFNRFLETADFWFFLSSRIIFQTGLSIYLINQEIISSSTDYFLIGALSLSFILNVNWFIQITKNYLSASKQLKLSL